MLVGCFYSGLVGGLRFVARVALLAHIGGLALCVPLVVSSSGYCLLMYSSPSRLFVTHIVWCVGFQLMGPIGIEVCWLALLACVGGLAFVVSAFGGFLL